MSHPFGTMSGVETSASLRFAETARLLAAEARRHGLKSPGFRCPPRLPGATRTVRWAPTGACIVSVQVRGRDPADVLRDMVEGVLVANHFTGEAAHGWRVALRSAVAELDAEAA
jgi:hypothetical protein